MNNNQDFVTSSIIDEEMSAEQMDAVTGGVSAHGVYQFFDTIVGSAAKLGEAGMEMGANFGGSRAAVPGAIAGAGVGGFGGLMAGAVIGTVTAIENAVRS